MEDFAGYILNEQDYMQKMIIAYYASKKTGMFFDKSTILREQVAKMFLDYVSLNVDKNEILTAMLLCNCKKTDNRQKIGKLEDYAKDGAEYLSTLGFNQHFCKICEGLTRYSKSEPRKKESDVLELVDQFCDLITKRVERDAFTPKEALVVLQERNLKNVHNRYLEDFIIFVEAMENVYIKDTIEVPVMRKLVSLTEREKSVKSFIAKLGNNYSEKIEKLMNVNIKKESERLLTVDTKRDNTVEKTKNTVKTIHRYTRVIQKENSEKSLFSKEVADRILSHEAVYKIND